MNLIRSALPLLRAATTLAPLLFPLAAATLPARAAAQAPTTPAAAPVIGCAYGYGTDAAAPCALPCATDITAAITSFQTCPPPVFKPVAALALPGAGTFRHQYLGDLTGLPFQTPASLQVAVFGPSSNVAVANLQLSPTGPDGTSTQNVSEQFAYGDIIVGSANTPPTALVMTFSQSGTALLTALDQVTVAAAGTSGACPVDVTAQIKVTATAPVQLVGTQLWTEVLTLQNTGGTIGGPLQLALGNLSPNARLFGASATGTCPGIAGASLQTVPIAGLGANASVKTILTFTNSLLPSSAITFTPIIVAGGNQR